MPEGSPSFALVMNDLTLEEKGEKPPISPLVLDDNPFASIQPGAAETASADSSPPKDSPVGKGSPAVARQRICSASAASPNGNTRSRSYSWNHRYKLVMERRKTLSLKVPNPATNSGPSSAHSSPMIRR